MRAVRMMQMKIKSLEANKTSICNIQLKHPASKGKIKP
jgi:hypothetical protein